MARPASSVYSRDLQHLRLPSFLTNTSTANNTSKNTSNNNSNNNSNNDSTVTSISGLLRNAEDQPHSDTRQTVTITNRNKEKKENKKNNKKNKTVDLLNALIAVLTLALLVLLVLSCVVALGGFNHHSPSSSSPPIDTQTASSGIRISPGVPDEPSSTDTTPVPTSLPTPTTTATATTSTGQEREKLSALIPFLTFAAGKTMTLDGPDAAQTAGS